MTHADWVAAKERRDNAAHRLARAYIAGATPFADEQAAKFAEADAEMERIEKDLDGRGSK